MTLCLAASLIQLGYNTGPVLVFGMYISVFVAYFIITLAHATLSRLAIIALVSKFFPFIKGIIGATGLSTAGATGRFFRVSYDSKNLVVRNELVLYSPESFYNKVEVYMQNNLILSD